MENALEENACKRGYCGVDCSIKGCPDHCGANGYCHEGTCFCKPGFAGENCRQLTCGPNNVVDTDNVVAANVNVKRHGAVMIVPIDHVHI